MYALVCAIFLFAAAAAKPVVDDAVWHRVVVNDEIDEFLAAVNEGLQVAGYNYFKVPETISMLDAEFKNIMVGEGSTWARQKDSVLYATGLNNFTLESKLGLGVFQIMVNDFTTGNYSGLLNAFVLGNSFDLIFNVTNRFQANCHVEVTHLDMSEISNIRFYTPDLLGTGLMLEKTFILQYFKKYFVENNYGLAAYNLVQGALDTFFCKKHTTMHNFINSLYFSEDGNLMYKL